MFSNLYSLLVLTSYDLVGALATSNHAGSAPVRSCDYVVIGGGTAGLTVATRLAEPGHLTVCVIEAGGFYEQDAGNKSSVPGYASYGSNVDPSTAADTPEIDWGSARNFMVYQRGNAQAYDMWADQVGDQSYSWDRFLPYFRKSANYSAPNMDLRAANATVPAPSSGAFSPAGGPLRVSHANWALPMSSYAEAAFSSSIGIAPLQDLSSDEKRSSSEASFLQYALRNGRNNLKIFTRTLAKKIMFDGNKAIGVVVTANGTEWTIKARKEVILSAGAFQSPQLLMVSGIGPKSDLQRLDIEVLIDAPGEVSVETQSELSDPAKALKAAQEYDKRHSGHSGILTSNGADYIDQEVAVQTFKRMRQLLNAEPFQAHINRRKKLRRAWLRCIRVSPLTPGHPQATIYAFAEKIAADILRGQY
ncbi:hypothetical protein EYC84_004068 [Monilinia fructicola]|uniref:Glucose-methanol-choline oxidoreductase N-terminal domain-containing protein n=1 Tax=Monilinia fructicola TaxID=38448 RepID=A0A5M9K479_MONFR|nr:hypothetical protein EYC84_004068 [Monilinia fructicola]